MKHKHYDAIIAYANGKTIEHFSSIFKRWVVARYPTFAEDEQYRVKPESVTRYLWAVKYNNGENWRMCSMYLTPEEAEQMFETNYTQVPNSAMTFEE